VRAENDLPRMLATGVGMMRWMVEISYRADRETLVKEIEELDELCALVENGPDWNEIDEILVTLNRPVIKPRPEPEGEP
jgi:hypothetical protein